MIPGQIVVRGGLHDAAMEDSWSPTEPFRSLKMFLAYAAGNICRVHQLDFVGAFLQANVRGRNLCYFAQRLWRY